MVLLDHLLKIHFDESWVWLWPSGPRDICYKQYVDRIPSFMCQVFSTPAEFYMGASACPDDYAPIYNASVCETRLDEKKAIDSGKDKNSSVEIYLNMHIYIYLLCVYINEGVNSGENGPLSEE